MYWDIHSIILKEETETLMGVVSFLKESQPCRGVLPFYLSRLLS